MRPNVRTPTRSYDDFENLGRAFEGLAGALHEGHPVDQEDLDAACTLAHALWPIRGGGRDHHEVEFEGARLECRASIPEAVSGDIKAWTRLQKACHHMGLALRWRARNLEGDGRGAASPWDAAHDARVGIRHLDQKYARYAPNPITLPM